MLKYHWNSVTITTNFQANSMVKMFKEQEPEIGGFDTETTGLHIILDKPFLFQFGWINRKTLEGYTFVVDLERQPKLARAVIKVWHELAASLHKYFAHNIKYDLHMLTNIELPYLKENLSDTMFYIRYAHDALGPAEGGPPLGLKDYAAKYIDRNAKYHEQLLARERTDQAKMYNLKLKQRLSTCQLPDKLKDQYRSFTLSAIQDLFKDPIAEVQDFPQDIQDAYNNWKTLDLPLYLQKKVTQLVESDMIRYDKLNRDNLIKYAHYDIIYMLELEELTRDVIEARQQWTAVQIEESLILPLYEMERVGFKTDVEYLHETRERLKQYIIERRKELVELTQKEFAIGQHAVVKDLLSSDFNVDITSTNSAELDLVMSKLIIANPDDPAIKVIKIIQELRTLEKWYSVYVMRFLKDLQNTDRLYTTINQVGTVSGRVTSNFQQFPRDPILTHDGIELFHPRRMVCISENGYDGIVYLDYSQIELRFQAMYTILVGNPDLNLCRAYMPYQCHLKDGTKFDYTDPTLIKRWREEWYLDEEPETRWEPTDVHGATTTAATGLKKGDPGFKEARYAIGKRTNFAKNYGAQYNKIRQMFPEKTEEECRRIDNAYYTAFPGVKSYHNYCYQRATESFTVNLFGVKYYNISGHKLINMLIQGSAAFYLKWKIRQVYEYMKAKNLKSKWQMQIHDELSWEKYQGEDAEFFEFQSIMQDWSDGLVPIVADMEVTTTTWAEKKEVETLEEFQSHFSN